MIFVKNIVQNTFRPRQRIIAASLVLLIAGVLGADGLAHAAQEAEASLDWPMRRYDAQRSGSTPMALAEELHLQWVLELPAPRRAWPEQWDDREKVGFDISYEPVAAAGLLFVPSMVTDSVTAYAIDTGEAQWRYHADGPVRLAPAYSQGRLYFGSDDGHLYCVDASSGDLVWRFQAAPRDRTVLGNERVISMWPVRGAPVIKDGVVYFAAGIWPFEGVYIYALDAESGEVVWLNSGIGEMMLDAYGGSSYSFGTVAPQGSLAVSEETLIVPGGRTTPAFYNLHTGELIEFDVGKREGGYAVSADGLLPVRQSRIRVADVEHDCEMWSGRVEGRVWRLLAAQHRLFAVTEEGRIYCFGPEEREPVTHSHQPAVLDFPGDAWTERAQTILTETGANAGYAVMYGIGSGRLLEELLAQSDLHIVAYDPDEARVAELRERFCGADLYGSRVAVHQGNALSRPLPPYIASLVVSEDIDAAGFAAGEAFAQALFHPMRPYGGAAYLFGESSQRVLLAETVTGAELEQAVLDDSNDALVITRPGALPGSDSWTHQYANAGNTVYSNDARVRAPLGIAWFGGENNHRTLPRHMFGPIPLVVEGKLLIMGVDHLTARCVYTGRRIWVEELPRVGEAFTSMAHEEQFNQGRAMYFPSFYGANFRGSPYVATRDSVYIIHEDRCLRLDLATGETLAEFHLPDRVDLTMRAGTEDRDLPHSYTANVHVAELEQRWGYINVWGDFLIVAAYPHMFEEPAEILASDNHVGQDGRGREEIQADRFWHWNATSSEYLLAMDRRSGKIQWVRQARYGFRHNAIAAGAGRTFAIDNVSERILEKLARRGVEPDFDAAIHAIQLDSGDTLWTYTCEVFGTWLSYSEKFDVVFQGGRAGGRSVLLDEPRERMVALQGEDGTELWQLNESHSGPPALHEANGWIIGGDRRRAVALLTGELIDRANPICGATEPWRYSRTKGCGTHNTSRYLVTFRSGAAAYYDLFNESGTANLSGFRAGCTNNLVAADGILNAPEYTRSCTCAYQHQTSLGFVHMPDTEMWTHSVYGDPGVIERVGINFGAPGSRVTDDGVMWINYPWIRNVPSPTLAIEVETTEDVQWFGKHSLEIMEENGSPRWVISSGGEGVTRVALAGLLGAREDAGSNYTVRMHFAERRGVDPGERVFDVLLDGETVLQGFDIAAATGGCLRGIVKEFATGSGSAMVLELRKTEGAVRNPIINGIELIADGVSMKVADNVPQSFEHSASSGQGRPGT